MMPAKTIPLLVVLSLTTMAVALGAPTASAACVTDLACFAMCTASFPEACIDPAACAEGDAARCVDLTTECLTTYPQCGPPL